MVKNLLQLINVVRFWQEKRAAGDILADLGAIARGKDDLQRGMRNAALARQFNARHAGQTDIGKQHLELLLRERLQSQFCTADALCLMTKRIKQFADQMLRVEIV